MSKNDKQKLYIVGKFQKAFDDLLNLNLTNKRIYRSEGLVKHVLKRHPSYVSYIGSIPDIIKNPDYIGVNSTNDENSIEIIKKYDRYILIGIKLDLEKDYLYVASLYGISKSKIKRRLYSGRLKPVGKKSLISNKPSGSSTSLA